MRTEPHIRNIVTPKLSVIIPTYNRAEILRCCLRALDKQELPPHECEILVIDDGSEDHTPQVVGNSHKKYKTHYLYQENKGPAAARNFGIQQARGDTILILNEDAIVDNDLLQHHFLIHEKLQIDGSLCGLACTLLFLLA